VRFINISYFVGCWHKPEWSPAVQRSKSELQLAEVIYTANHWLGKPEVAFLNIVRRVEKYQRGM